MSSQHPTITNAKGTRTFDCLPAAVLAFIVTQNEQILMLSHPKRRGYWEVINGALDANETLVEGALREIREEAGTEIRVKPLGVIHAYTFRYDDSVQYMISVCYLMAYEGGDVHPGDDMQGSELRWFSLEELADENVKILAPRDKWLYTRAIDLFRLLKDQPVPELEPVRDPSVKNKYDMQYSSNEDAS
jgi:8-oxo-dGTP pyrophosphatase MutT (NUDIX family)